MKKQSVSKSTLPALRRLSAGAMLCCATSVVPVVTPLLVLLPASAQAAADDAALNFVGADIESVIKAVGHYTNITFVIDPRVKGTLTVVSEKPVTKSQAFGLLTSALRLQGYAVVSGDGYAKVVPEADAKLQAGPTQVGASQASAKGDQIVSQIFHLNYESAANVVTVLRPLISPNNTINANPGNNTVVVTDYADNVKRLAKIVAALDAPAVADLDVIPVRYAIASDLASMVNKLMDTGAGAGDAGKVSVLADPRTNALILRAPSAARANLAKSLIAKLDQPTQELGNVHVVYLKNAEAAKLAQTLRSVVSGDTSAANATGVGGTGTGQSGQGGLGQGGLGGQSSNTGGMGGGSNSGTSSGPSNPLLTGSNQQQQGGGGTAGYIQADSTTNTLIITAPESVYRNLRAVIDQLDVRRAQVYIESLIVEVSSDKASEFGVQWVGATGNENSTYRVGGLQSYSSGGNNIGTLATQLLNKSSTTTTAPSLPGNGLSIGVFKQVAGGLGLGALAHSLETDGNANVLSTPNMITLDNELATISVGQNVPILTGQFTTTSGTNNNPFQTIDRKEVGLTLKVRPQISEGGTIKLAIYHETSSVDATSLKNTAGITINKRVIENNVIADDGQIIVLGGLIEDTEGDGVEKVRGLGDIPVLGNLFKYQTRSRKKTNLMVFLRPVVIRSKEQSTSLATDRYDYMRAQQDAIQLQESILVRDLGQPKVPALQNGTPLGGAFVRPIPPAPAPVRDPGAAEPAKQQ
ncbi:type II secretion system protein GspD [Duganella sp. BJB488]|uniref:type II secretion system secretin GspD n=1 Tax=unclassified Duganella TaxID=2636909 RepID=UPI000E34B5B6|nr:MULTISPECIES: type II secretion system secretin GspD [unclassified Duganella]RFP24162.1 type II secretion system protein GspD [Duganella sp. BJB489]RFP26523.1 type II secretion system protein GspD [Duganella sp. BJB488]RFP34745.1 type II secretion system protein GspD [Duganella sp. BJB480]